MTQFTSPQYTHDLSTASRLSAIEDRLRRLESGVLPNGKGVLYVAQLALTGPWPASGSFSVSNPTSEVFFIWTATMYSTSGGGTYTVDLNIDGTLKDTISVPGSAAANSHFSAGMSSVGVSGLTVASHTAQIALGSGNSNGFDFGKVIILELPQ